MKAILTNTAYSYNVVRVNVPNNNPRCVRCGFFAVSTHLLVNGAAVCLGCHSCVVCKRRFALQEKCFSWAESESPLYGLCCPNHEIGVAITQFSLPLENKTNTFVKLAKELHENILQFASFKTSLNVLQTCQILYQKYTQWAPQAAHITDIKQSKQDYGCGAEEHALVDIAIQLPPGVSQYALFTRYSYNGINGTFNVDAQKNPVHSNNGTIASVHLDYSIYRNKFGSSIFRPVTINPFGATRGPSVFVDVAKPTQTTYCWDRNAKFKNADGSFIPADEICEGDVIVASDGSHTTVKRVMLTQMRRVTPMVNFKEFYVTPGHPMWLNSEWYRPDEIFPLERVFIDTVYNFYCEPSHILSVGEAVSWTFGSLGQYCPRLALSDPVSDALFGRGYGTPLADRYAWLLTLTERIPDELVEEACDAYHKSRLPITCIS